MKEIALSEQYNSFRIELEFNLDAHPFNNRYDRMKIDSILNMYDRFQTYEDYNIDDFKNVKGGPEYISHWISLEKSLDELESMYQFSKLDKGSKIEIRNLYFREKKLEGKSLRAKDYITLKGHKDAS